MPTYSNTVYYPNYRVYEGKTPASFNVEYISNLLYAFASVSADGTVFLQDPSVDKVRLVDGVRGCLRACVALKQRNRNLKVILCVGGAGFCNNSPAIFPAVASAAQSRNNFAKSAHSLVEMFGLDGVDGRQNLA